MAYGDETQEKLSDNFKLLCAIIGQNSAENPLKADLSKIEKIINKTIPEAFKENAPEDFYALYMDFKAEYEKFRDFILFDKLIGKNIVALGGGFSSGKSSFLNALMGKNVLPADIDPSTSVPTYIVKGEKNEVMGINIFNSKVQMRPRDIKKIAHGFGEIEDDNDEKITDAVTLGHVLENIFISTPLHQYENIAFLDTPGYSKPDSEKYSAKTDEQISRRQLNSSNYILWFVQSDAGTITEEDIKFIKTLRTGIPMLIVLNKADKKTVSDIKKIKGKIESTLSIKGILHEGVFAFSKNLEQIADEEAKDFIEADAREIMKQIKLWNQRIYESEFARNFKTLFVKCRTYYEAEINEESRKLNWLNKSITKLAAEDIDEEILEPLHTMVNGTQRTIRELRNVEKRIINLQTLFFTEIKHISDLVHIDIPEPSELDLLQEQVMDFQQLLENYKTRNGIRTNFLILDEAIHSMFEKINEN